MIGWKQAAPVIIALVIALGVAAVFTTGMVFEDEGEDEDKDEGLESPAQPNQTLDENPPTNETTQSNYPPAPSTHIEDIGESPTEVNEFASFEEVAAAVGFDYEIGITLVSTGVYVVDYNNNGYEDILAIGGDKPVLFENTGGAYERVTEFEHQDTGAAHFLDYNNNGWRDLLIADYSNELVLYENNKGTFERNDEAINAETTFPVSITSADFTGDGCLDIFIGESGLWPDGHPVDRQHAKDVSENHPEVRPDPSPGLQNRLFHGDCKGFTEVTNQTAIKDERYTLAVSAADFTGNGYPDIHVGNEHSGDYLYENLGTGTIDTFERHDLGPQSDGNAMASVPKDMTGNHRQDIFVTAIYFPDNVESTVPGFEPLREAPIGAGNYFLVNENGANGSEIFTDRAAEYGLNKGGWGWAAAVEDFTNDGHLDIIHTTSEIPVEPYDEFQRFQMWKGLHDGWERVNSGELGVERHEGRGMATVDYNNNGVLDFVVATTPFRFDQRIDETSAYKLYENTHENNDSIQLWVRNPDGIERNAAVYIETDKRTIYRSATANGDYLSQNSRLIHVGTGNEEVQHVQVLWPDGTETVYEDVESGNRYILTPDGHEVVD